MPRVKFFYIEDALDKWAVIAAEAREKRESATIPETGEYLGALDFDYAIKGHASWKPVRVFNDGVKTIIEMPKVVSRKEAPTLLVVRRHGRIFRKSEEVMVNYRVQNRRYIVDAVFDRAVMIVGVGGNQEKVTITHTPKKEGN
jgi:type IV secretion system protein VirB9